jgi:hypothetical protein
VLDEILAPTVWQDQDGKYYPGGIKGASPTYLKVNSLKAQPIPSGIYGCGMNVVKAEAIDYLTKTFYTAAVAQTSLTVKSAGGLEVGLGILGKLNVGDNSTLTALLKGVVGQVVKRLTVAFAAPVLEAIEIEKRPAFAASGGLTALTLPRPPANRLVDKAEQIRLYSAPFISSYARI